MPVPRESSPPQATLPWGWGEGGPSPPSRLLPPYLLFARLDGSVGWRVPSCLLMTLELHSGHLEVRGIQLQVPSQPFYELLLHPYPVRSVPAASGSFSRLCRACSGSSSTNPWTGVIALLSLCPGVFEWSFPKYGQGPGAGGKSHLKTHVVMPPPPPLPRFGRMTH